MQKSLKTAICLSGHFRMFQDIYQNFIDNLYLPFKNAGDVDIFIDTWSELNSSNSFASQQGDTLVDSNKLDIDLIKKMYNPISLRVDNFDEIKQEFIMDKYYDLNQLNYVHKSCYNKDTRIQYCIPMFYKWFRCNELKKEHEEKNNFKYDIVIKMRPDIFFFKPIIPAEIDTNFIYFRGLTQDFFILSSSENIDKVTNIYQNLSNLIKKYECDYLPEQLLEYHLQENGFNHSKNRYFGEYSFQLYPRKLFIQSCYDILTRFGAEQQFYYLMDKYGKNFNYNVLEQLRLG